MIETTRHILKERARCMCPILGSAYHWNNTASDIKMVGHPRTERDGEALWALDLTPTQTLFGLPAPLPASCTEGVASFLSVGCVLPGSNDEPLAFHAPLPGRGDVQAAARHRPGCGVARPVGCGAPVAATGPQDYAGARADH